MPRSDPAVTASPSATSPGALPDPNVSLAPRSGRDPWLDNTRLVAAVLIVVMHVAGSAMSSTGVLHELWYATWPLRLPLFVIVAGFFSSAEPLRGRRAISILRNVLGVYLVGDLLASIFSGLAGEAFVYNPIRPPLGLWFLLSLFWWRAMLPLVAHVRFLGPLTVAASLLVGLVPQIGPSFSASRTIVFLPLFVLGWYLRRIDLRGLIDRRGVRPGAAIVLAGAFAGFALWGDRIAHGVYQMRSGYDAEGLLDAVPQLGARAALLLAGAAGALALLAVMPRRRVPVMTYLGTGSMYIYVIHVMVLGGTGLRETSWYAAIDTMPEMIGLILASVVAALALASPPVRWLTGWLVQPRYRWLFREQVPSTPPLGEARSS